MKENKRVEGEGIVRRKWFYEEEKHQRKYTGIGEQKERGKEEWGREKRGLNSNRKVERQEKRIGCSDEELESKRPKTKHSEGEMERKKERAKHCYHLESIENEWAAWRGYNHIHQQHCLLQPVLLILLCLPPSVSLNHQLWSILRHTKKKIFVKRTL